MQGFEADEKTVMLALKEDGGLFPIMSQGQDNAQNLRVIVSAQPFIQRRALGIVRRYFPAYRAHGAEIHLYGKLKARAK